MDTMFRPWVRERRLNWRRELTPVLAVGGLLADYLSPAALWTILLPFAAVVALAALRKWVPAALVFLLSSWVFIPVAANVVTSVEEMSGKPTLLMLADEIPQTLYDVTSLGCLPKDVGVYVLPVGEGHLLNPRFAMRDVVLTFADVHNQIVLDRAGVACGEITGP